MTRNDAPDTERAAHNARQAAIFDSAVAFFLRPIPPEIAERTTRIVALAGLPAGAAVLDVGTGVGVLINHLRAAGAQRIVACDLSAQMLAHARERHGDHAEFFHGDIIDLPPASSPFDAVFFNAMFGNVYDPAAALRQAHRLLRPGGRVIISHPMGRAWHARLREQNPDMIPHDLPDQQAAAALFASTGFRLLTAIDEADLYAVVGEAKT